MKKTIIYTVIGIVILFAGIKIGASKSSHNQIKEFEIYRHQGISSEIDIQAKLLKLIIDNKSYEAKKVLTKWIEQNICEMGAYKQSKLFVNSEETTNSIINMKRLLYNNDIKLNECSNNTFTGYSSLISK